MNWDYCTYVPLLYEATRITQGPVVELGVGLCSTPLLHALVTWGPNPRELYSVDDDANWLAVLRSRQMNEKHEYVHVVDWEKNLQPIVKLNPGVVFIDNGAIKDIPGAKKLRTRMIELFQYSAQVLIVHDFSNVLQETNELPLFKHRFVDHHTQPTTLWLSHTTPPEFVFRRI